MTEQCLVSILAPKLRVIGTMSVGYEHIDMDECNKRFVLWFMFCALC